MDFFVIVLWSLVAILACILILCLVCKPDPEQAFREQCRAQGMTFREEQAAVAIRISFARLRRILSDACIEAQGDISDWHLGEVIRREAAGLHLIHGYEAAKSFTSWAKECGLVEVMYQDARDAYVAHLRSKMQPVEPLPEHVRRQNEQDRRAAFTILPR